MVSGTRLVITSCECTVMKLNFLKIHIKVMSFIIARARNDECNPIIYYDLNNAAHHENVVWLCS